MILGIGTDIVEIERFKKLIFGSEKLRKRLFTESENLKPLHSLAARFAAKEAMQKALGSRHGLNWLDFEILNNPDGSPKINVFGELKSHLKENKIFISLSHENLFASATVIISS